MEYQIYTFDEVAFEYCMLSDILHLLMQFQRLCNIILTDTVNVIHWRVSTQHFLRQRVIPIHLCMNDAKTTHPPPRCTCESTYQSYLLLNLIKNTLQHGEQHLPPCVAPEDRPKRNLLRLTTRIAARIITPVLPRSLYCAHQSIINKCYE